MKITKLHIVQYRSIRDVVVCPRISNLFADIPEGLKRSDVMAAIKYVLGDDAVDETKQPDLGQVSVNISFSDAETLPALLINQHGVREFTVTRYSCQPWSSINIAFDGNTEDAQRKMSVENFRQLLYGSTPPQHLLDNDGHMRPMVPWLAKNDSEGQSFIQHHLTGELRQCNQLFSYLSVHLEADEKLSLERRALRSLRSERAEDLLNQLQLIELQLDDEPAMQVYRALQLCECDKLKLLCQRNIFEMFGADKRDNLFDKYTAIRELLDVVKRWTYVAQPLGELPGAAAMRQERQRLHDELAVLDDECMPVLAVQYRRTAQLFVASESSGLVEMQSHNSDSLLREIDDTMAKLADTRAGFEAAIADTQRMLDDIEAKMAQLRIRSAIGQTSIADGVELCLQHIGSLHREHIEWLSYFTTNLFHTGFFAVFQLETLFGVARMNELLDKNDELSNDFVGYVIDFVHFRSQHVRLAAFVQHAMRDMLLNGIFIHERTMHACMAKKRLGQMRLWSLETFKPNPLPMGQRDDPSLRPLSKFMRPITINGGGNIAARLQHIVAELLDEFVVLDSDAYTLHEAAQLTRRNVICARSGRFTRYGSPYEAWPVEEASTAAGATTVFDLWKGTVNRREHAAELVNSDQLFQGRQKMLQRDATDLFRQQMNVERLKAERAELLLQLNRLQKSTFDNDRIYYRCRVMRLEHEQLLDAYSASLAHPEEAATIDRGMLYMHLGLDKIAAMQSMAKSESTTQQITQIFESTSELILADQVADGGDVEAAADMRWVDECLRRAEVHRTVCSDDWQRTEEDDDTVGGASTVRRLAETEAKLVVLIERSHLHTKAHSLRELLNRARHEERQQSVADVTLQNEFENMSKGEIIRRQRDIDDLVEPDAVLVRRRRLCTEFQRRLEAGDDVLALHRVLMACDQRRRQQHLTAVLDLMRTLIPLMDRRAERMLPGLVLLMKEGGIAIGGPDECQGTVATRHQSVELVLRDDLHGHRIVHLGRNEKRCLALLWYLADCVVRKECSVLLLDELMQEFSATERVQIMNILRSANVFNGFQWFGVTDETALIPFIAPDL